MNKKLTIITINFNNREGLQRTFDSIFGQTCHDFEYVVIDGGSTDGSVDLIRSKSNHIDFWISEPDSGIYNAMNKGICHAHGQYCLFINSGDTLHDPDVVGHVLPELDGTDIIYGRVKIDGKPTHTIKNANFSNIRGLGICHQGLFNSTVLLKNFLTMNLSK